MTFSQDLAWRNLIKDKTFADATWLDEPKSFYLGIDVGSANSMTVGNLAVIMLARRLLDKGWKTILLVGGATSLIGDPGGKDEERELVSREQVEANKAGIRDQIERLFEGKHYTLVDNYDWFKDVLYLEFLRDVGKSFSLSELIQRDFIAERIRQGGSGISYAEFSYSLIQGYDYWQLFKREGTVLQIGGSDQWGNMLSGVPLIRKKEGAEAHALSMPLVIDKATGKKFGKSETGAIWLDKEKTSIYQFYQFWLNASDAGVEDYLKVYTLLPRTEIETLIAEFRLHPEQRLAQKRLAEEVTTLVHGREQAAKQTRIAKALFGETSIGELSDTELATVRQEVPGAKFAAGTSLMEVLVKTGLAASNTEARRLLDAGAVYVNNQKTTKSNLEPGDFQNSRLLLRRGKALKDTALIELA